MRNVPGKAAARSKQRVERPFRTHAVLLTTDYRPQIGGIAEYLAGLWNEAGQWGEATAYSTIPGGDVLDARTTTLLNPPERKLGGRIGDRIPLVRRVNTAAHFAALRRYARQTLSPILDTLEQRTRVCIGVWNPLAHFWCDALTAVKQPYALFAYGLDVIQPLYGTVAPWRVADFRGAARVIGCSAATAAMVGTRLGVPATRLRVVNPGIDVAAFIPPSGAEVAATRKAVDVTGDQLVLSVGRLVRRKGFDVALRAFAAYRASAQRGQYVIAGDGPERAALEALARELGVRDHVRFVGAIDERTKLALYELCDVFVMPNSALDDSDWEGFGIVFLEAARAGKPSLGGANGGVPDAIAHRVTGLLVDPADQRQVSAALGTLLSDDALRTRLGAAARDRAASSFDWPVVGARFRDVLEEPWQGALA